MLYLSDGFVRGVAVGECDEGVAAVEAGHGVHHEPQVPDGAALLEQGDQVVFVQIAGDLTAKYLKDNEHRNYFLGCKNLRSFLDVRKM